MDGSNAKRSVAFEFVSENDFNQWETDYKGGVTVYSHNTIDTARALRQGLIKAKPSGYYAVFYEPYASEPVRYARDRSGQIDYRAGRDAARKKAIERDRRLLRAQVRDFIKWLKVQGVI